MSLDETAKTPRSLAFGPNVSLSMRGRVAVILIDNPPVNASSAAVRGGLLQALGHAAADSSADAVVIAGAGRTFVSGSDIREFGKKLPPPELPDILQFIGDCPKPVVAAIHGAALGGGYELALACDARIAAPDAVVGLPEVSLGIIPGAGGTQRLPRLVGIPQAIELITQARRVAAGEAMALGMVDAIARNDLIAEAAALALSTGKRQLGLVEVPQAAGADVEAAAARAMAKARGRECVREAIDAIRLAATASFADALAHERTVFQRLRVGEEAAALRYAFFAERVASRFGAESTPRPTQRCGVVGAGTMGAGIAAALLAAGLEVTLVDSDAAALHRARATIAEGLRPPADDAGATERLSRLRTASRMTDLAQADLVVEAVFEDLAVKEAVLSELGRLARPGTIIATNTSYLDIERLAAFAGRPGDFIGLHFFAPVLRMKLMEVVACRDTSPDVTGTAFSLARRIGKLPVLAGPGEGFIGNRIYARYRAQCEYCLEDGALPQEVDAVAKELGFALGLFAVSDISGLDVARRLRRSKDASRDPRERYVAIPDRVCELGRLGRRTGAGWYDYGDDGRPVPSPVVAELVRQAAHGRSAPGKQVIADRIMGAIVNEAALLLAQGIARSAQEIDVVLVNGYGFSRFRGGPLYQVSRQPRARLAAMVDAAAAATGWGFVRGDVEALLAGIDATG